MTSADDGPVVYASRFVPVFVNGRVFRERELIS